MRIQNIQSQSKNKAPNFKGAGLANIQKRVAKGFSKIDGIGEGASIAFDFVGKAVVVPAIIIAASKEPKEKKEYSAMKNPVAAIIQLAIEVPILLFGSKAVESLANKGTLDKKDSDFSYNAKKYQDEFVSVLKQQTDDTPNIKKAADSLAGEISKKGYSRKIAENFDDFINTIPNDTKSPVKETLKKSFGKYQSTHKNLFHLQNRACFIMAITLTPLICALENWAHPKIMDKLYQKPEATLNPKKTNSIYKFLHQTKKSTKSEKTTNQNGNKRKESNSTKKL